ncbi:MAG: hypothetical protein ACT4OX_07365 [Actinomycetota bacterium]
MRPTVVVSLVAAVLIALSGLALGVYGFVERNGGKAWFYWAAPLFAFLFGGMMAMLVLQYHARVGRLETKGRPRQ